MEDFFESHSEDVPGFAKSGFFGKELGDLLLKLGQAYKRDDHFLDDWMRSLSGLKKMCYQTSSEIALAYPEQLTYVEGYAFADIPFPYPVAHAWLVTREGLVVDPTWDEGYGYFGIGFSATELSEYLLLSKEYGLLQSLYRNPRLCKDLGNRKAIT